MLKSIMNSPMAFFDQTPSGRILNRFSKNIEESKLWRQSRKCLKAKNTSSDVCFSVDTPIPFLLEAVTQYSMMCLSQVRSCHVLLTSSIQLCVFRFKI